MAVDGINQRLEALGFQIGISYQAYIYPLSNTTMFVIEGRRVKGYPTYRYTFYKVSYFYKDGRRCNEKVYFEDASVVDTVRFVEKILRNIQNKKEVNK
ncbi:hypothetical protein QJV45_02635 [Listeria booriae]|uniref:hypothetical protein n=1 Tax=Listeria booriae TaxID=1552123 RepID=UPI0028807B8D|nr:hypothetical protein [Listeria booriae]MDT0109339.1 hypothetical protein [Listeria booriae]